MVTYQYIADTLVDVFSFNQGMKGGIIGEIIAVFVCSGNVLEHGWFYKREQIKIYGTIFILQGNAGDVFDSRIPP